MRDVLFFFPDGRNQVCGWAHLNVLFSFHSSGELELCPPLLVNPIFGLSWRTLPICARYLQKCQNKPGARKSSILHMSTLHISKGTPRSSPETRFSDCSGMVFVIEFQTIASRLWKGHLPDRALQGILRKKRERFAAGCSQVSHDNYSQ